MIHGRIVGSGNENSPNLVGEHAQRQTQLTPKLHHHIKGPPTTNVLCAPLLLLLSAIKSSSSLACGSVSDVHRCSNVVI